MITLELTEQEANDLALLLMFTDNECYDSIKRQLSELLPEQLHEVKDNKVS